MILKTFRGIPLALVFTAAGLVTSSNAAQATPRKGLTVVVMSPLAASDVVKVSQPRKSSAGRGKAQFDWLAPSRRAGKVRPVSNRGVAARRMPSLGSGSWICSPAGFGSQSRCHRR